MTGLEASEHIQELGCKVMALLVVGKQFVEEPLLLREDRRGEVVDSP